MPFLENVTRGRGIPRERLEEVGQHYFLFGGRSPINDQNRELLDALREDLAGAGLDLPVYWGNRNWDPYLTDTLRQMAADGVTRAACFVTSAYSSYSGCRQYRENLADAAAGGAGRARGSTSCGTTSTTRASWSRWSTRPWPPWPSCPTTCATGAQLAFVTHSIPTAMNDGSRPRAAAPTSRSTAASPRRSSSGCARRPAAGTGHELVFCSRSGAPHIPWLEPDVNDHLRALHDDGRRGGGDGADRLRLRPHGGHLRPRHRGAGDRRGARPAGDPRRDRRGRPAVRRRGPRPAAGAGRRRARRGRRPGPRSAACRACWDRCPVGCCPNPRGPRPALCGADS